MRLFVTGASGFIGSAVVPELLSAGHQVLGLARSDASARAIAAAGAEVLRGDLNDLASLRTGAERSDAVVHLGFIHDFSNFEASIRTDLQAIEAMGRVLERSRRTLAIASGVAALAPGRVATEETAYEGTPHPRSANALAAMGFAERGVRVSLLRFAPTVHGPGDHGFIKTLVDIARQKGASATVGDGANRWTAVHRLDAARMVRLAVEKTSARPVSIFHAVAEESIPTRSIAEVIGRHLGVPVVAVAPDAAAAHFGWMARFFALDQPASSALTREQLGWSPTNPGLLEDLEQGHYFG